MHLHKRGSFYQEKVETPKKVGGWERDEGNIVLTEFLDGVSGRG